MVTFLTSSFVEYQPKKYVPKPLDASNGFADNLKRYWPEHARFLVFACDPSDAKTADHVTEEMRDAFALAGFDIEEIRCFDDRAIESYRKKSGCSVEDADRETLKSALRWANVFYLSGGHGPTENTFMKRCGLRDLLQDREIFDGIFIGLSAGAVNAAEEVYMPPELLGEAADPNFVRFTDGLGLTGLNIMPHLSYEKTVTLDGMRLVDEIIAKDSYGREIYLIPDGAYFIIRNGITEFFGEGEIMENGVSRPLHSGIVHCDNERVRRACSEPVNESVRFFQTIVSDRYDCIMEVQPESGRVTFLHISDFWLAKGIIPVHIDTMEELNHILAERLVVQDEREPFLEQSTAEVILDEIAHKGGYVMTVHLDTGDEIKADNLRCSLIAGDKSRLLVSYTDISMILDHDWMTDEYSRSGFIAQAEKLLKEPEYREGYSVVYANVQGFKAVNDLLGLHSGDMVIFMTRDILVRALQPVLTARLESDHFALIVKTEKLTEERLEEMCHQCYEEESKRLPILIRCGICHIGGEGEEGEIKIQRMLDRAKLAENSLDPSHGNCYAVCDKRMSDDYVDRRRLISEIDNAFAKGEFRTYYQPVVDAMTGEIVSAEALIRWRHSERGMVSPGQFVPVFEKEGYITRIDSFMVNSVLAFNCERMQKNQKVVPCAVNLSRVDFYDVKLLEMLKTKLGNQEHVRDMLKLEVTESAYAELESDAISFLDEMKRLGLALMLDDFGSGMSSFSTLESFEFDIIKLDMGFISQIGKGRRVEAIIKHIIGLSHDVGAKVVAEGVETKEQLTFLQSVGCDMIQGYYFYKPMPEEEFAKLLS
ncbi:MAG: EAL domain-containing protein [Butyrivibrio sp.]|nr:EAL domain-containing protein [Muribaculum sp.]MCM1552176.1 EAL domain-containing protein [Butyrivibrio sp.]